VGDISRKKYYNFRNSLAFGKQFYDKKATTSSVGLDLNWVSYTKSKSSSVGPSPHFYTGNLGFTRIKSNNMADLSTTEMTDGRKYSEGDSSHSLGTKYNVYPDSVIKYRAWWLYANNYFTFGKNRNSPGTCSGM